MLKKNKTLPKDTALENYRIIKTLGTGGFSSVYLAEDLDYGVEVVLKEYMPKRWAERNSDLSISTISDDMKEAFGQGRKLFFQEASVLSKLDHPAIVNVINFFSANGTVYMVMDYHQGQNLQSYINKHKKGLSEKFINTVFPPLLSGLKIIHEQGLLHLDIKPGNIHLKSGGRPILLDFGASKQILSSRKDQSGQVVTNGFSPIEQHRHNGYVGPWSDLYAIGATMRSCIESKPPPSSPERYDNDTLVPAVIAFKNNYTSHLLKAIDWLMEVDPLLRPQKVEEIQSFLNSNDHVQGMKIK